MEFVDIYIYIYVFIKIENELVIEKTNLFYLFKEKLTWHDLFPFYLLYFISIREWHYFVM